MVRLSAVKLRNAAVNYSNKRIFLVQYKDIADFEAYAKMKVDYSDLCNPDWLEKDPEIFYGTNLARNKLPKPSDLACPLPLGFWGKCYNDYKDTPSHEGYKILYKWRHRLFKPKHFAGEIGSKPSRRMHIYTSNVDRMFNKAGFLLDEVEEIHGNAIVMQCAKPCAQHLWSLDPQFRYRVPVETMRAPDEKTNDGQFDNHPRCSECKGPARPNVLMFGDMTYFEAPPASSEFSYRQFATNVETVLRSKQGAKLVVLEMGAGKRVPSIRNHCQRWINDATLGDFGVTLIRINPDFPDLDPLAWHPNSPYPTEFVPLKRLVLKHSCTDATKTEKWFNFISFKAGALSTLKRIHEEMISLVKSVDDSIDVESEEESGANSHDTTESSSSAKPDAK